MFPHPEPAQTGGALVRREHSIARTDIGPDGAFAVVLDTEGNSVGLHTASA